MKEKFDGWLLHRELAKCEQFWNQLPSNLDRLIFLAILPHLDEAGSIPRDAAKIKATCFPLCGTPFVWVIEEAITSFHRTRPPLVAPDGHGNIVFRDFKRLNQELLEQRNTSKQQIETQSALATARKQFYFEVAKGFIECQGFRVDDPKKVWPYVRRYGRVLRDLFMQANGSSETAIGVMLMAKHELESAKLPWGLEAVGKNYLRFFKAYGAKTSGNGGEKSYKCKTCDKRREPGYDTCADCGGRRF